MTSIEQPHDEPLVPHWPTAHSDLLASDEDWRLVACMDFPRDRWIGYVNGYRKGADVIVRHVEDAGSDQDYLVYPFLMCWRHYVELQLKVLIVIANVFRRQPVVVPGTHRLDHLWRVTRPLLEEAFPGESTLDLAHVERILMQLHGFDPTSEHFRYPVRRDGSETLGSLGKIHFGGFHAAMEGVASLLDGCETGMRVGNDSRADYLQAMNDLYGQYDEGGWS